jgi:hypothetical protein
MATLQARWQQRIPKGDGGVQRVERLHGALTELEEVTAVGGGLGSRWQPVLAGDGEAPRGRGGGVRVAASSPLEEDGLLGLDSTRGDGTHKVSSSSALEARSHRLQWRHEEQSERHKRWWRVRTASVRTGSI